MLAPSPPVSRRPAHGWWGSMRPAVCVDFRVCAARARQARGPGRRRGNETWRVWVLGLRGEGGKHEAVSHTDGLPASRRVVTRGVVAAL